MFNLFKNTTTTDLPPIHLYNTASKSKEVFEPFKKNVVTIYTCGPTVYDHIHIGNLRAYLLPDILQRVFLYNGYKVKLTINFTDFGHLTDDGDEGEDKMMKGMKREGLPVTLTAMRTFAEQYIESFKHDNKAFGNLPATNYTRASDYITEQIKLIQTLIEKGYAYEIRDGVYFDISKYPEYGVLGNIDLDEMKAGARVEVNKEKKHPADFALWKKGSLGWESDWGTGFPGWHIECTAMAFATLGKQIDIHTGGVDLMSTHHNGEIAQAECITGKTFTKYWLHNEHVTITDEKLAKSSGNGFKLQDLIDKGFSPFDYRYWLLTSHYRTRTDFSYKALKSAKQALTRLKRLVYEELKDVRVSQPSAEYEKRFITAMHDDLDTPKAISILWELVKDSNVTPEETLATIHTFDSILEIGLSLQPDEGATALGFVEPSNIPEEIQLLIDERETARIAQNWSEADRLRDAVEIKGYVLEDAPEGPRVSKI